MTTLYSNRNYLKTKGVANQRPRANKKDKIAATILRLIKYKDTKGLRPILVRLLNLKKMPIDAFAKDFGADFALLVVARMIRDKEWKWEEKCPICGSQHAEEACTAETDLFEAMKGNKSLRGKKTYHDLRQGYLVTLSELRVWVT